MCRNSIRSNSSTRMLAISTKILASRSADTVVMTASQPSWCGLCRSWMVPVQSQAARDDVAGHVGQGPVLGVGAGAHPREALCEADAQLDGEHVPTTLLSFSPRNVRAWRPGQPPP